MTRLKQKMEAANVGTCRLARLTGINYSRISCYRGGSARPNHKTAKKIADALNVPVADLWAEPLAGQSEGE